MKGLVSGADKMLTDWHSDKARALNMSRNLTQNRYPLLLKLQLLAGFLG
jgi:hypothetical protein